MMRVGDLVCVPPPDSVGPALIGALLDSNVGNSVIGDLSSVGANVGISVVDDSIGRTVGLGTPFGVSVGKKVGKKVGTSVSAKTGGSVGTGFSKRNGEVRILQKQMETII